MTKHEYTAADVTPEMETLVFETLHVLVVTGKKGSTQVMIDGIAESIAAAVSASPLWAEVKELRAENEALRRERDQAVQSYAADRERFAAQEERHRVRIEHNRELVALVQRGIDGSACVCTEEEYFDVGICWTCLAEATLAKHGAAMDREERDVTYHRIAVGALERCGKDVKEFEI